MVVERSEPVRARRVSLQRILLAGILLFVGAIVLDRIAEVALKQLLLHSSYRYMRVYEQGPAAHYLIVGNSRAGSHFPHSANGGTEFFNLGNGGMTVAYGAALARDYIDHHGARGTAIIEVSFLSDARSGEDVAGLARIFSARVEALPTDHGRFERAAARLFHLLRFNQPMLANALVGLLWERQERADSARISPAVLTEVARTPAYEMDASADNIETTGRLIRDLRRRGMMVVCVLTPIAGERRAKISNLAKFIAQMRMMAEANGASFLDYSAYFSDDALFADTLHLNSEGEKRFDDAFFKKIAG